MVKHLQGIYEQVKVAIHEANAQYKAQVDNHHCQIFSEVGDTLTHDHFPIREYNKLKKKKIGPCEILQKINENA